MMASSLGLFKRVDAVPFHHSIEFSRALALSASSADTGSSIIILFPPNPVPAASVAVTTLLPLESFS